MNQTAVFNVAGGVEAGQIPDVIGSKAELLSNAV